MNENLEKILEDCGNIKYRSIDEKDMIGEMTIEDLFSKGIPEKHVASFEVPDSVKNVLNVDEINAVVSWYHLWKLTSPIADQTTCGIKKTFGYKDGIRAIIAINFYKYLRNLGYDPNVVEYFLKTQ